MGKINILINLVILMVLISMSGCLNQSQQPQNTAGLNNGSSQPGTAAPHMAAGSEKSATEPPSTTINLVARNIAFDKSTITVSKGAQITINFANQDEGVPHNFAVYGTDSGPVSVFRGKITTGPANITYIFKAPDQTGTYLFQCDIHPANMKGQFIVVDQSASEARIESVNSTGIQTDVKTPATPSRKTYASNDSTAPELAPVQRVTINLTAKNIAYDMSTITVPAGASVTINFDNQDAKTTHNFAVYENEAAQKAIFQGKLITGPGKVAYNFIAPNTPGAYFFRCDVHPTIMKGQFIVESTGTIGPTSSANATNPGNHLESPSSSESVSSSPSTSLMSGMAMPGFSRGGAVLVEIKKLAFSPDSVTVPAGTTVIWRNLDSVQHTVTSTTGKFDSNIIDPGKDFNYTFMDAGTDDYNCKIHPFMKANVIVTSSNAPQPAAAAIDSSKVGVTVPLSSGTMAVPVSTTSPQPPVSVIVDLLAKNMVFDKDKITVLAGSRVYINFINLDVGVPHNFAVYTGSEATTSIFQGQIIIGPAKITYSFDAPVDTGTYFFRCDVHSKVMTGDFYVVSSDNLATGQIGKPGLTEMKMPVVAASNIAASEAVTTNETLSAKAGKLSQTGMQSVSVDLTAENVSFDKNTITVPAGARVTINFNNRDSGVPHDFAVYDTQAAQTVIFRGNIISGPEKTTYNFVAPNTPGTYFFRCDVHPGQMNGRFIVQ